MGVPTHRARGAQATFGIEQEDPRCHNPVTRDEAGPDLDPVGELDTQRHHAWFEAIADGHEHVLARAGVDHGIARHREHR